MPADASAVYANIAILGQTANGYLRTYAADAAVPTTGALGFDNSAQAESVAIPLSSAGAFTVLVGAGGPVDLLVDVQGYFTAGDTSGGGFTPAAVHLLDTRAAPIRTLPGNGMLTIPVAGVAGIPAVGTSLTAVALTVRTVQAPAGPASGFLRLWPTDQPEPATLSINYTSQNIYRTDLAIVAPAANGTITVHNGGPNPIDLVLDVQGWFADPGPSMPVVTSDDYPQDGWAPSAAAGTFSVSDDIDATPPAGYQYALDGGNPATVAGAAPQISVPLPATLGLHSLTVTAIDQYGTSSPANDYTFNVGTPPDQPANPAVTVGDSSADLTWAAGPEHGAPTLGYRFTATDQTTSATPIDLGTCATCNHLIITGLDPTHSYTAQVTAVSAAGESPTSTTAPFTPNGTTPLACLDSDDSCASQNSQTPPASDNLYDNYDVPGINDQTDAGTTGTGDASMITDPQCNQPTDQRTGNWVCPIADTTSVINPGGGTGGYCDYTGACYTQISQLAARWTGTVEFGTRATGPLGTATADITWKLAGALSWSSVVTWKATSEAKHIIFSSTLFNGSPRAAHGGSPVSHTTSFSPTTAFAAPGTAVSWRPNGYKAYDQTMWDHNVITEFSWSVPGARGYFWMYARSPCSHTAVRNRGASYRFGPYLTFPTDLKRAGWNA